AGQLAAIQLEHRQTVNLQPLPAGQDDADDAGHDDGQNRGKGADPLSHLSQSPNLKKGDEVQEDVVDPEHDPNASPSWTAAIILYSSGWDLWIFIRFISRLTQRWVVDPLASLASSGFRRIS